MFDISWTEFLLIAVVALVVIGPKELPAVLRTLGQWTRKMRSMASEFQNQFQEAMREAEMADLKKQVDDIAHDVKNYDPLKEVRADVEAANRDIQASLDKPLMTGAAEATPAEIAAVEAAAAEAPVTEAAATEPVATEALEHLPDAIIPEPDVVAAAIAPVTPDAVEAIAKPDTAGHTE
jgi:sec-independent protein translocase protein TatB